ncbi:MAG: hypothetical protein WC675_04565 [Patescibacteria group bacterium]|jgi:hypothetical protein
MKGNLSKGRIILLAMVLGFVFIFVYSPHFSYPFPFHIDEWHHISQSIRLGNYGDYFQMMQLENARRAPGMEIGFHFFLFLISWLFNLVSTYQFLPAFWAVISALVLFFVVYKKTDRNFFLALLAIIFFGSLKSNTNLTGLWFFTPLTFSIPLIFLYFYLFSEGVEKQNNKLILASLALMIILIPTHSISLLFALPALIIYLIFNFKYVFKNSLLFLTFLIIPIFGVLFYKYILDVPWGQLISHLAQTLQFPHGWGVLELKNSPFEIYNWAGYFFALVGVAAIVLSHKTKKYLIYLLWPATIIISIIIYRTTGISYLSPYQRNFYYLAISLPFLSAFGLYTFIILTRKYLQRFVFLPPNQSVGAVTINIKVNPKYERLTLNLVTTIIFCVVLILTFANYYSIPKQLGLYQVIDSDDYQVLTYLSSLPKGKVMSNPFLASAIFPVTGNETVADVSFYGDRKIIEEFFLFSECPRKDEIIKEQNVRYIISPAPLSCDFKVIYAQKNNIVYEVVQ